MYKKIAMKGKTRMKARGQTIATMYTVVVIIIDQYFFFHVKNQL